MSPFRSVTAYLNHPQTHLIVFVGVSVEELKDMTEENSCLQQGIKSGAALGAVGLVISAAQNSLEKHNHGAMGVLTRTGGTIGYFAAAGAIFALTECAVKQARNKEDFWNSAAAGCAAGVVVGVRAHSLPVLCGACAAFGTALGVFEYAGGDIKGGFYRDKKGLQEWNDGIFKKNVQKEDA